MDRAVRRHVEGVESPVDGPAEPAGGDDVVGRCRGCADGRPAGPYVYCFECRVTRAHGVPVPAREPVITIGTRVTEWPDGSEEERRSPPPTPGHLVRQQTFE